MGGFPSRRPVLGDLNNYLGIEFEATIEPAGRSRWNRYCDKNKWNRVMWYQAMEHEFAKGVGANIIEVQHREGEVSCLVKETEYRPILKEIMDVRERIGDYCPPWCGIHIHVDTRNRSTDAMYKRFTAHLKELMAFRSVARAQSDSPNKTNDGIPHVFGGCGGAFNVAREGYSTIEIRLLDANYDFERTCAYIDFILDLANDRHVPMAKAA